jgi:hypothetical protein
LRYRFDHVIISRYLIATPLIRRRQSVEVSRVRSGRQKNGLFDGQRTVRRTVRRAVPSCKGHISSHAVRFQRAALGPRVGITGGLEGSDPQFNLQPPDPYLFMNWGSVLTSQLAPAFSLFMRPGTGNASPIAKQHVSRQTSVKYTH